jgi:hypothetical protein
VFRQLEEETSLDPVARMTVRQDELKTVSSDVMIERFAAQLRAAPTPARVVRPEEQPRPDDRVRH